MKYKWAYGHESGCQHLAKRQSFEADFWWFSISSNVCRQSWVFRVSLQKNLLTSARRLTCRTVRGPLVAETNVALIRKGVINGLEEARINRLRVQEEYIIYLVLPVSWPPCSPYSFVLTLCLAIRLVWQSEFHTHTKHAVSNNYTNLRRRKYYSNNI